MNQFLMNIHRRDPRVISSRTENGAISNSSTGSNLIDQFGKAASHRGRSFSDVSFDQIRIWRDDKLAALRFTLYLRLITRKIKGSFTTDKIQLGQGNRDEAFKRLIWIAKNDPEIFYENLWLVPIVGSWKDLWVILIMGRELNVRLDENKFFDLIGAAIRDENERPLIQKFLPAIRANSKCSTDRAKILNSLAKGFCSYLGWEPSKYRKFKSTGEAHVFQRVLCSKLYDHLNWNHIPGRALSQITSSKFLQKHGLEEIYEAWLDKQPTAKFNGYAYELGDKVTRSMKPLLMKTIDKQFKALLANNNPLVLNGRRVISAIDRSSSMLQLVADASTMAMNVAESLGLYFSNLLPGPFNKWVIKFSRRSEWVQLKGGFCEQKGQMTWGDCPSSTDFQSIIDSFVTMRRKYPSIPESDFPNTLLVVSDMQFDRSGPKTTYNIAVQRLKSAFSQEFCDDFQFIWWDCTGRCPNDFPQTVSEPNGYVISGFDGAIISLILGGEKKIDEKTGKTRELTMEEKIQSALTQEVLLQATV